MVCLYFDTGSSDLKERRQQLTHHITRGYGLQTARHFLILIIMQNSIGRTHDSQPGTIHNVQINLRRGYVFMPQ